MRFEKKIPEHREGGRVASSLSLHGKKEKEKNISELNGKKGRGGNVAGGVLPRLFSTVE